MSEYVWPDPLLIEETNYKLGVMLDTVTDYDHLAWQLYALPLLSGKVPDRKAELLRDFFSNGVFIYPDGRVSVQAVSLYAQKVQLQDKSVYSVMEKVVPLLKGIMSPVSSVSEEKRPYAQIAWSLYQLCNRLALSAFVSAYSKA